MYTLIDNYIDGKKFLKLTEAEVKSMVAPIGIAKKILRLIPKVHVTCISLLSVITTNYFEA